MSYMYQSYQTVPSRVIKQIGEDIKANMFLRLQSMDAQHLNAIFHDLDMAIDQIVKENAPTVDGYQLTDKQVMEIAQFIRAGKTIAAIKEFRRATSEQLRESKFFIDKFTKGRSYEEAYILFTNTFSN